MRHSKGDMGRLVQQSLVNLLQQTADEVVDRRAQKLIAKALRKIEKAARRGRYECSILAWRYETARRLSTLLTEMFGLQTLRVGPWPWHVEVNWNTSSKTESEDFAAKFIARFPGPGRVEKAN